MNPSQTVFTVFFAIFWSTVANAWPRWKPFHWPIALRVPRVLARLLAAMLVLNILPVLHAGIVLWLLRIQSKDPPGSLGGWLMLCVVGVFPALSIFGYSRLWVGLVELKPSWFYLRRGEFTVAGLPAASSSEDEVEPSQETLRLDRSIEFGSPDMLVGLGYIVVSVAIAWRVCVKFVGPGSTRLRALPSIPPSAR